MQTQVPNNWQTTYLGNVMAVNMGQSPSSKFYNTQGKGLPFYQGVTDFGEKYPSPNLYCSQPVKTAEPGTVLFSVRAPVGDVNFVTEKSCIGRGVASLDMKNGNNDFLYFLLKARTKIFKAISGGTTYKSINKNQIENTAIAIPKSDNEQKKIASILSAFDDKIEVNNKIANTLEEMAQEIFKEWFVKFRFPGHEKVKFVDSELGKIPVGWEIKRWEELEGESLAGDWGEDRVSTDKTEKAYILRGTDIPELKSGTKGECPIRYLSKDSLERRHLKIGDIIIEISGGSKNQPTGRSLFITKNIIERFEFPLVCTSFCRLLRSNFIFRPIYMYLHLQRLYKSKAILNYQLQSTGISNFQYGYFKKSENLAIPPAKLQKEVEKLINDCIAYGQNNENQKLAEMCDLLLPKLMKGEIRV